MVTENIEFKKRRRTDQKFSCRLQCVKMVSSFVIVLFSIGSAVSQTAVVKLSEEKQLIRGFGGMNCPTWISDLTAEQATTAFGNGPGQLGLTILRMMVNDNSNNWSKEVATAKRAAALGAICFASPWNPPSSMCETVNGKKRLKYDQYGKYADHLNSFIDYMKTNGVDLYAISVQNEPDYADQWTWWTSAEIVNFLKKNASVLKTKVIAPESFQYVKSMSDPILKDADALAAIDILGAHLYGTQVSNFPYPLFKANGKDKELWMTEVYTESNNDADKWPLALDVAAHIHNAMTEAEFNCYVWWYIRRSYGFIKDNGQVSKRGYCMAHFSKFIRPGYKRVEATAKPMTGVLLSAYKGVDSVVVVAVNQNTSVKTVSISIPGINAKTFTKYTTSAAKNVADDGAVAVENETVTLSMDASSVVTLAGRCGASEISRKSAIRGKNCNAICRNPEMVTAGSNGKTGFKVYDLRGCAVESVSGTDNVSAAGGLYFLVNKPDGRTENRYPFRVVR